MAHNLKTIVPKLKYTAITIFVLLSLFLLHRESYNQMPVSKHIWAQTDWYSISLGFLRNDFNFFKPETYQLNLQFPSTMDDAVLSGITACDFPLIPYLSALVMRLTHISSPIIFRSISLLLSLIGLFFFYRTIFSNSKNMLISLSLTCFIAFQPIFTYYMNGFLPTFNSISFLLIGSFYFNKYLKKRTLSTFIIGTVFFSIAALIRFPFIVHNIAILCVTILVFLISKRFYAKEFLIGFSGLLIVLGYFLYNQHLAHAYGSLFLNHWLPVNSLGGFFKVIFLALKNHSYSFLPFPSLLIFSLIVYKSVKHVFPLKDYLSTKSLFAAFIVIDIIGISLYSILMQKQFVNHDYYLMDTFFIPVIFILLFFTKYITVQLTPAVRLLMLLYITSSLQIAFDSQRRLYDEHHMGYSSIKDDFEGSELLLDSLSIDNTKRILVLPTPRSPGLPFIFMNRKGYKTLNNSNTSINNIVQRNYDYLIFPNKQKKIIKHIYPSFKTDNSFIYSNGKLEIWSKKN
ncbi:hypothetical protein SAMN06265379_111128 [Saccharicrinis carchari]|uniref:Dolichyl-phosphate-mannose-protein mannosyltransferase n=1 Tax=Saccharicrinis carchari TaxID=1168039 RepID=A0A521EVY2_SACCC|nr:hypothetical protein [Saccharicrinis carchari]SMO88075.1 hypothetical protein SAMN06265379_111128 [Saccharicrinis carchari]